MTLRTEIEADVAALFAEFKDGGLVESGTLHPGGLLPGGDHDPVTGVRTKGKPDQAFDYVEGRQSVAEALGVVLAGQSVGSLRHVDLVIYALTASLSGVVPTTEDQATLDGTRYAMVKVDPIYGILYRFGLRTQSGTPGVT